MQFIYLFFKSKPLFFLRVVFSFLRLKSAIAIEFLLLALTYLNGWGKGQVLGDRESCLAEEIAFILFLVGYLAYTLGLIATLCRP